MELLIASLNYLKWHYGRALFTTFEFWKNILVFLFNYFSIKNLIGNFFTPWKRLADNYPERFNLKKYTFTFLINTIMRIVGMFLRLIVIALGVIVCVLYIVALPLSLIVWFALPVAVVALVLYGIILIIFS